MPIKTILTKDIINSNRQLNLDYTKGLSILFMVLIHMQKTFSKYDIYIYEKTILFLGGPPSAVVFMILMGISFAYSKNNDYCTTIKRGVTLLGIGYLLNFLRGTLPSVIEYFFYGNYKYLIFSITDLMEVDILHFAGLATLFFAITRKHNFSIKLYAIMALFLASINTLLIPINHTFVSTFENPYTNIFFMGIRGLFIGGTEISAFPFFTWLFYPIVGYLFAQILLRTDTLKKLYKNTLKISGSVMLIILSVICVMIYFKVEICSTYFYHGILYNILFSSFGLVWICLIYFVARYFPNLIKNTLTRWSKNITSIFCIHWVIIGILSLLIDANRLSTLYYTLLAIVVLSLSDVLASIYKKLKSKFYSTKRKVGE